MSCAGEVYRGLWRETDVAIKMLFEHDVREKTVNNFKKEVSIIKKLRHPNILQFVRYIFPSQIVFVASSRGHVHCQIYRNMCTEV